MSFEKQMYEVKEKWEMSYFSEQDSRRIEFIRTLIPDDVETLLDVGCGNGILVNYLSEKHPDLLKRLCATDRSKTSLEFVKVENYESDITALPFADGEFDIVVCLEVIEHLPQEVFAKALLELERVTNKYVIISVPFNEDLDFKRVKCTKCQTEFSPFYHMHSFNDQRMEGLFENTKMTFVELHKVESREIPRMRYLKKWISRKINPNGFPPNCICPMCGYNELEKLKQTSNPSPNPDSTPKSRSGLSKWWPHREEPKWVAALYKK